MTSGARFKEPALGYRYPISWALANASIRFRAPSLTWQMTGSCVRFLREVETLRDLEVGMSFTDLSQDFSLPVGEWVAAGLGRRRTGNAPIIQHDASYEGPRSTDPEALRQVAAPALLAPETIAKELVSFE